MRAVTVFAALTLIAASSTAAHAVVSPRLLHAEPVNMEASPRARPLALGSGPEALQLQAFGRRFELLVEPSPGFPAEVGYRHDQGTVGGAADSWVRLTRHGTELSGLLYTAGEYYAIEPAHEVQPLLAPDALVTDAQHVMYRLSDLLIDPGSIACGIEPGSDGRVRASAALDALRQELAAPTMAEAVVNPQRRITLAPVADEEFALRYGAVAEAQMLSRLNTVDGIFVGQVGIDIVPGTPQVLRAADAGYPFTATDHRDLLDQVSDYRAVRHRDFGLTHLFSHKDFAGNVAGVAWLRSACTAREGAALSSSSGLTTVISALVAAHEIGHNFGAPHDGESGSACAATPTTFLMAPTGSGSSTFSGCSLAQMASAIGDIAAIYPACLTVVRDFDVDVTAPGILELEPGETAEVQIIVTNAGTEMATNVRLEASAPAALAIVSATTLTGFCDDPLPDLLSCDRTTLGAGANWPVTLEVRGASVGRYTLGATVTADTDRTPQNNSVQITVIVGDPPLAGGGGGGGGGGSLGVLTLLCLPLLLRLRRRGHPTPLARSR